MEDLLTNLLSTLLSILLRTESLLVGFVAVVVMAFKGGYRVSRIAASLLLGGGIMAILGVVWSFSYMTNVCGVGQPLSGKACGMEALLPFFLGGVFCLAAPVLLLIGIIAWVKIRGRKVSLETETGLESG